MTFFYHFRSTLCNVIDVNVQILIGKHWGLAFHFDVITRSSKSIDNFISFIAIVRLTHQKQEEHLIEVEEELAMRVVRYRNRYIFLLKITA